MSRRIQEYCLVFIYFIFLFNTIKCDLKEDVKRRVDELEERSRRLYGNAQRKPIKQWELDVDDSLSYPNGDKQKLAIISHLWSEYYQCTSRIVDGLTSAGRLPSVNIIAYDGSTVRLPCGLCVAPDEGGNIAWFYAKSLHNLTFAPITEETTRVININLTIYNTRTGDAGVYRCQLGRSVSELVVLEVLDDEVHDVTDLQTSYYTAFESVISSNVIAFNVWTEWSECSRCDRAGIRRRYGMCYVRLNNNEHKTAIDKHTSTATLNSASKDARLKLFQEFPTGIACRSHLLPLTYRLDPSINKRQNIIMVEACKVPCKKIFEIRSRTGELIERANNSAGVYSLNQMLLPQPPAPVRDVMFVEYGDKFTLICPGTTLHDVPVTWRIGTKYFDGIEIDKETERRVRLTATNHIVFSSVDYSDSNVYSCWQSLNLAGVVKLRVWRDARFANGRLVAAILLIVVVVALRFAVRLMRSQLRHLP